MRAIRGHDRPCLINKGSRFHLIAGAGGPLISINKPPAPHAARVNLLTKITPAATLNINKFFIHPSTLDGCPLRPLRQRGTYLHLGASNVVFASCHPPISSLCIVVHSDRHVTTLAFFSSSLPLSFSSCYSVWVILSAQFGERSVSGSRPFVTCVRGFRQFVEKCSGSDSSRVSLARLTRCTRSRVERCHSVLVVLVRPPWSAQRVARIARGPTLGLLVSGA